MWPKYSSGSIESYLNLPSIYFSLRKVSTELISSSAVNGKGSFLGFQILLALLLPILSNLLTSESPHLSKDNDLTCEMSLPNLRWTLAHLPHKKIPKLQEAHVGYVLPHSPHRFEFSGALSNSINFCSVRDCFPIVNLMSFVFD